ncbi:hypothetical protein ACE939_04655 [Aquimarina sp. W85]|uniref:hypothetical protein n=1 Tax=Aquimarina rhodophyticola TaxID=3342246 RepID=UPI003670C3DA
MDLPSRKIVFVQEFLKLQDEEIISRLENVLNNENAFAFEEMLVPMSMTALHDMLAQAEKDFQSENYISMGVLISKFK